MSSSRLSLKYADEARLAVLAHFKASSSEYTVVFTANASAALKLVAEAYPFSGGSSLVIGADSHNSVSDAPVLLSFFLDSSKVHGIREFATSKSAEVHYVPSTPRGGFDVPMAKVH